MREDQFSGAPQRTHASIARLSADDNTAGGSGMPRAPHEDVIKLHSIAESAGFAVLGAMYGWPSTTVDVNVTYVPIASPSAK
jgi:hypothetical protein